MKVSSISEELGEEVDFIKSSLFSNYIRKQLMDAEDVFIREFPNGLELREEYRDLVDAFVEELEELADDAQEDYEEQPQNFQPETLF